MAENSQAQTSKAESGSIRGKAARERLDRIKANRPPPGVRVVPANDEMRKILRHPRGLRFRSEGAMEWPNDRFTKRRLADGSITLEERPRDQQQDQQQQPTSRRRGEGSSQSGEASAEAPRAK
jgi:hypothetical protein